MKHSQTILVFKNPATVASHLCLHRGTLVTVSLSPICLEIVVSNFSWWNQCHQKTGYQGKGFWIFLYPGNIFFSSLAWTHLAKSALFGYTMFLAPHLKWHAERISKHIWNFLSPSEGEKYVSFILLFSTALTLCWYLCYIHIFVCLREQGACFGPCSIPKA